jgi:hypothetical protein
MRVHRSLFARHVNPQADSGGVERFEQRGQAAVTARSLSMSDLAIVS